jgi:CRP-like cAMP-binding protein
MDSKLNCRYNYLMQHIEPDKLIEASSLFRNLQPDETAHILARLQPAIYESDTRILESGIWHGRLYILASGTVSVFLQEDTSYGARIAQLEPGECFGEMPLITGEPPSATVRADEDIAVWALQEEDFLTLIRTCPTLLQNINAILSQRLARTNRQILSHVAAEKIWLPLMYNPTALQEGSLIVHIADALATRSHKRVLMLEACGQDQAIGPYFATLRNQLRPALLDCVQDHSLLQAHRASTRTTEGQYFPAFAAFAVRLPG